MVDTLIHGGYYLMGFINQQPQFSPGITNLRGMVGKSSEI
jgi:hypothetical protein